MGSIRDSKQKAISSSGVKIHSNSLNVNVKALSGSLVDYLVTKYQIKTANKGK